ncbi:hypothetical protein HMPREF1321_2041 [Capnocytophaga sp. oral taxon 412 str. F0487]|nr:hypothetical protein HMPREF1321_2041 [Capnocytophaga sp. oral taxon 412 str. F0487]EJF35136.1 hypothetical protein HMPREF1320_2128 [Capnocytophaga sp. oral taxon 335 str. F0486]
MNLLCKTMAFSSNNATNFFKSLIKQRTLYIWGKNTLSF